MLLTKVCAWLGRPPQHQPPEEHVQMTEDDKRRRSSRTAVVLFDQLISLELPYTVCVVLHFLEGKAVKQQH